MFLTAIYGGYFGAAQGVILIALLGIFIDDHLQRLNAFKNVLVAMVNGVAALLFVIFAPVAYLPAALLAVGSAIGGQIGAKVGRRLAPNLLRTLIVVVGVGVAIKLFVSPCRHRLQALQGRRRVTITLIANPSTISTAAMMMSA